MCCVVQKQLIQIFFWYNPASYESRLGAQRLQTLQIPKPLLLDHSSLFRPPASLESKFSTLRTSNPSNSSNPSNWTVKKAKTVKRSKTQDRQVPCIGIIYEVPRLSLRKKLRAKKGCFEHWEVGARKLLFVPGMAISQYPKQAALIESSICPGLRSVFVIAATQLAWENSRHLATLPLVSTPNDFTRPRSLLTSLGCLCLKRRWIVCMHVRLAGVLKMLSPNGPFCVRQFFSAKNYLETK